VRQRCLQWLRSSELLLFIPPHYYCLPQRSFTVHGRNADLATVTGNPRPKRHGLRAPIPSHSDPRTLPPPTAP
jgi:hypothetical protein